MKTSPIPTHTLLAVQGSEGYKIQQAKEGKTNHLEARAEVPKHIKRKEERKTNEIGAVSYRLPKNTGKNALEGRKAGKVSVKREQPLLSRLYLFCSPQLLLVSFSAVVPDE